jgi:hypothetical protein
MNKKKFIATIIILAFFVIPICGVQFFRMVEANPLPIDTTSPNTNSPILSIQSPSNITYSTNNISLNITVAKPSSWDDSDTMREISYTLDGQNYPLWVSSLGKEATDCTFPAIKELSAVLTGLSDGQHTLKVDVTAQTKYFPNPNFFFASYESFGTTQTINFTVNNSSSTAPSTNPNFTLSPPLSQSPNPTSSSYPALSPIQEPTQSTKPAITSGTDALNPLPMMIGIAAVVIGAIAASALVYFKKIKK